MLSVFCFRISLKLFACLSDNRIFCIYLRQRAWNFMLFLLKENPQSKYSSFDLYRTFSSRIECHNWTIWDDIVAFDLQPSNVKESSQPNKSFPLDFRIRIWNSEFPYRIQMTKILSHFNCGLCTNKLNHLINILQSICWAMRPTTGFSTFGFNVLFRCCYLRCISADYLTKLCSIYGIHSTDSNRYDKQSKCHWCE